jgi:hypothetical protein
MPYLRQTDFYLLSFMGYGNLGAETNNNQSSKYRDGMLMLMQIVKFEQYNTLQT